MEFVEIPAGTFWMGSDNALPSPPDCPKDDPFTEKNENAECWERWRSIQKKEYPDEETPRHQVRISKSLWIGKYEVTQEQWYRVMDNNPSYYKSESVGGNSRNHPVEQVWWDDVQSFIRRLNEMEKTNVYRLPTEAEWEYACRAGSTGKWGFGDKENLLSEYAWYGDQFNTTHQVGQKKPNAWGLYDMHGNVSEWVQDSYSASYYKECSRQGVVTDPQGPPDIGDGVSRGGGSSSIADECRSARRTRPARENRYLGFRLARN
jgi:formylglycine-generating enzyme required for sulfatase activity